MPVAGFCTAIVFCAKNFIFLRSQELTNEVIYYTKLPCLPNFPFQG